MLTIYIVKFHNSDIQGKLILRQKFTFAQVHMHTHKHTHTYTKDTLTIKNGLIQDASPSFHL